MMLQDLLKTKNLFAIIESPMMAGEAKDDYERVKNRLKMFLHQMEVDEEAFSYQSHINFCRYDSDGYREWVDSVYPQHQQIIRKIKAFSYLLDSQRRQKEKKNESFITWVYAVCGMIIRSTPYLSSLLFSQLASYLLFARPIAKLLNYLPLKASPFRLPDPSLFPKNIWVEVDYVNSEVNANLFAKIALLFDWCYRAVGGIFGIILGVVATAPLIALGFFITAGYFYTYAKRKAQQSVARNKKTFLAIPRDPEREAFLSALKDKNSSLGEVFSSSEIADKQPLRHVFEFLSGDLTSSSRVLTRKKGQWKQAQSSSPRVSDGELLQTQGVFPHSPFRSQPSPRVEDLTDEDKLSQHP